MSNDVLRIDLFSGVIPKDKFERLSMHSFESDDIAYPKREEKKDETCDFRESKMICADEQIYSNLCRDELE